MERNGDKKQTQEIKYQIGKERDNKQTMVKWKARELDNMSDNDIWKKERYRELKNTQKKTRRNRELDKQRGKYRLDEKQ